MKCVRSLILFLFGEQRHRTIPVLEERRRSSPKSKRTSSEMHWEVEVAAAKQDFVAKTITGGKTLAEIQAEEEDKK